MVLRIKELIKQKGLTITEVAERMNVNRVNLSNMISGNPTIKSLEQIAEAMEVDVWELFISPEQLKDKELSAMVKYKENLYTANSISELEDIIRKLKQEKI